MENNKIVYLNREVEVLNGQVVINELESDSINISGDSLVSIEGANVFEAYA